MTARMYKALVLSMSRHKQSSYSLVTAFGLLFHGVALEVLQLHSVFGMAFPIHSKLQETVPSLYRLLVPDSSELVLFQEIKWSFPSRERPQKHIGWSNFPVMLWVVCRLVEASILCIENAEKELFLSKIETNRKTPSPWGLCPRLFFQSDVKTTPILMSLSDTILFLLFELGFGNHRSLCERIETLFRARAIKDVSDKLGSCMIN
jgi:hypothetical protein